MILVDTSIWIDHLRANNPVLARLLDTSMVLAHPWVTGELALGTMSQREQMLSSLHALPQATLATDDEIVRLINREHLHGRGIGYVDAGLLAAVRLTPGSRLWTKDKRLVGIATDLTLSFTPYN